MIKRIFVLLISVVCTVCLQMPVAARPHGIYAESTLEEGKPGAATELSVYCGTALSEYGALLVRVEFDSEIFDFQRVTQKPERGEDDSVVVAGDGWVDACFVADSEGGLSGCLALRFIVRDTADFGESAFCISAYSPDAVEEVFSSQIPFVVLPPPSDRAALTELSAGIGKLVPDFSTDCFSYNISVPHEVDSMSFSAVPVDGATCKVNRKKLGAVGTKTDFDITVTAADGKTKSIYTVCVLREEAPSPSPDSKPTAMPPTEKSEPTASASPAAMPTPEPPAPTAEPLPTVTDAPVPAPSSAVTPDPVPQPQKTDKAVEHVIKNSEISIAPAAVAIAVVIASVGISKPLARVICAWLDNRNNRKK